MPISSGKALKTHLGASKPMFERVNALEKLLQTKGAATSRDELVKRLKRKGYIQVSVRTIQRDINYLKKRGQAITYSKNTGYTWVGAEDKLRGLLSSREEMLPGIVIMRGVLNAVSKLDSTAGADVLLSHAGDLLEENGLQYGDLGNFISSAALPMPERMVPVFRMLVKGLIQKRALQITYMGYKDPKPRQRTIHPYHLLEFEGRWYCIAKCIEAQATRTFMLWRTGKAELLDDEFKRLAEFDNPKTWEARAKIFGVWSDQGDPMLVRVRLSGYAAKLMQEAERRHPSMTVTESKVADGAVEVTFQTHAFADVTPWIFRWGPYCEVLEPPELVKEVRKLIGQMGDVYRR